MSGRRQTNRDLDELIDEITVDCYDEDEQLQGFETALDEDASFPVSGTVVGERPHRRLPTLDQSLTGNPS